MGKVKREPEWENEATIFAMLLLMPSKFIKEDLKDGMEINDDDRLKALCKKYDVSLTAMCMRIAWFKKHNY